MRTSLILAAMAMVCAIDQGTAWAKGDSPAASPPASAVVDGRVTKIEADRGRVTIRSDDGTAHEFEASKETLQGLKVGDRIEAKQRPASD